MSIDQQKIAAARQAVTLVEDGMLVGLGSGTTAEIAIRLLGDRVRAGLHVSGVPTSVESETLARSLGIDIVPLDDDVTLDLAIDGADEVDPHLNLTKGHGGQLLREKIVAAAARHFVVIVDSTKLVPRLGARASIPVEVIPFGWTTTRRRLQALGLASELRGVPTPFVTAGQNVILDTHQQGEINFADPQVGDAIKLQVGVVEHGLFLRADQPRTILVGTASGTVDTLT